MEEVVAETAAGSTREAVQRQRMQTFTSEVCVDPRATSPSQEGGRGRGVGRQGRATELTEVSEDEE
eukprot:scaffold232909_cov18-Tisochrysis_lutea.AAC.1